MIFRPLDGVKPGQTKCHVYAFIISGKYMGTYTLLKLGTDLVSRVEEMIYFLK